ncbi:lipase_3 domain-containing protein, partial [Haematococcus lacustris]
MNGDSACSPELDSQGPTVFNEAASRILPRLKQSADADWQLFDLDQVVFDVQWDLLAYIGYLPSQDAIVVAFRGTDSSSWGNWINNLKAWRLNKMYPIPEAPKAMVHAGHSMGAALASLCAMDLKFKLNFTEWATSTSSVWPPLVQAWTVDMTTSGGMIEQKVLLCDDSGEDPSCHNSACMLGLCTSVADHLSYLGLEMYKDSMEC